MKRWHSLQVGFCWSLILSFFTLSCDDESIEKPEPSTRDVGVMTDMLAGDMAGTNAGEMAGMSAGDMAGMSAGEMAGMSAGDMAGMSAGDMVQFCAEGTSYCESDTSVVLCVDGIYSDPIACLSNETCLAGRCLSACDQASVRSDYQGCSFWAIDSDNIIDANGNGPGAAPSAVVLSNVSEVEADIVIQDAQGVIAHQSSLAPGETESYVLSRADLIGTHIGGKAWHVSSTQPVLAYQFSPLQRTSTSSVDATLLIPAPALDDSYRVLTWPGQGYNQRGTMSIIAVEEGLTTVTIVLSEESSEGIDFRGEMDSVAQRLMTPLAGEPWTEVLERGEVLNLQSGPFADLSGTLVFSDQKLALFAGTRCSNVPDQTPRCDHLEHQMLPLRNQGRNYIAPGGLPRANEATWYRVVATVDQTEITTQPPLPNTPLTLNAGEVASFSSTVPFSLNSTRPVMLGMFLASAEAGANGEGDPSFALLPPVEQFKDRYVFLTPSDFERDGLTLIANGEAQLELDGEVLTPTWIQVNEGGWQVAHLEIADGPHEISSSQEFAIIATGYDEEVSYAFTGGLRLEKLRESEPPPYSGLCADNQVPQTPCETQAAGQCKAGRLSCSPGEPAECDSLLSPSTEICNQLDDDCDGLIDEAQCADFDLERFSPSQERLTLTEGETMTFNVRTQGAAIGREVTWAVDGVPFIGESGSSLEWTPLAFEEGARVLTARVSDGERVAELTRSILVNDAPSNKPVIWGKVTLPNEPRCRGLTLNLDGGVSEGEVVIDPRGYYAIPVEAATYDIKVDTHFHALAPYPKGIVMVAENIEVDRLNVQKDIILPISTLSGRVISSNGGRLANTEITFDGECFVCYQETVSDATGSFEVLLYHSSWEINATPPATQNLPTKTINDFVINNDRLLDIIFGDVFTIQATVLDQYNQGVEGATIVFDSDDAQVSRVSGVNGSLTVQLPQGSYRVEIDRLHFSRPPNIGKGIAPIIESLSISGDLNDLQLPLPNAWVSGQITRQGDGLPQSGVLVDFDSDSSCFACSGLATSDINGQYGVPLLHGRYAIKLTPPVTSTYVNQDSPAIVVGQDTTHNMLLLGPAVVVQGTLSDPRGQRLAGLGIRTNGPTDISVTSDINGAFELRLLPGEYEFKIDTLFGNRPAGMPVGWVNFWQGTLSNDVTQDYVVPLSWISGRVQEAAGDVIPNALLSFDGDCFVCSQEAADINGEYEAILFQSTYTVEVTPPAPYAQQTLENIDCTNLETLLNIDL